jgi:RHS repeat-associated protein
MSGYRMRRKGSTSTSTRAVATAVVVTVGASLLTAAPALAAPRPPAPGVAARSVPVRAHPTRAPKPSATDGRGVTSVDHTALPNGGSVVVAVSGSVATVGGLPVSATALDDPRPGRQNATGTSVSSVRVDVADQTVARMAGVRGVLVGLSRVDGGGAAGRVSLRVGYAAFANAYGADFGTRLRLVALPSCVLATPQNPACQARTDLGSVNNAATATVSADVAVGTAGTSRVVALASSPSSDGATWSAPSLSMTSSWSAGSQGGDFGYSYPLRVPPSVGGPAPNLALQYSSGSVDGQTLAQNGQASWVGEGWDLPVGFVERSYRPCAQDGGTTEDLCWFSPYNATLVWNGRSSALVRDATTGVWHTADDDALKIEQLYGVTNWTYNGEYWRVTTKDGTQYYFGVNKRYAGDPAQTFGAQVEPVYGNNAGEPCHQSTFAASSCETGYRWNLDYVVDPRGNSMTYFYGKKVGYVGLNNNTNVQPYDINGYLDHIDYGTRAGSEGSVNAPAQVWFGRRERCIGGCTTAEYPDTPWDLYCGSTSSCPNLTSPAYWTQYKLSTISTRVWDAATSAYRNVDRWDLNHTFPTSGDNISPAGADTSPNLWLDTVTHVGYAPDGTQLAEPTMTFGGTPMFNRVDWGNDIGVAPYTHYRITSIVNGVGGQTLVSYSNQECARGWKPIPAFNPMRCFPQYLSNPPSPGFEWFHKYVVTSVTDQDLTGGSPDEVTTYAYSTGGSSDPSLWHHDVNEVTNDPLNRTTWAQWRGYSTVTTTRGAAGGTQTVTTTLSYRGLDGDATRGTTLQWGGRRTGLLTPLGTPGVTGSVSGLGGRCLDIVGGGTANGTRVQTWDCTGGANQVWQPLLGGMLKNPASGRCLDAYGFGTANGTPLQIWDCNGTSNQLWWTLPNGSIQNPNSGRCATAVNWGTANGTAIQLWDCTDNWTQRWAMQENGSVVNVQASRCVDIANGGTTNGTHIQTYQCTDGAAQQWQPQSNGSLRNPQSGRCLDVLSGGTANGTPIQLYDCTGSGGQVWVPQADGSLKNPQSGRCLEAGYQPSNGLQMVLWDCTGALTQLWTQRLVDSEGLQGFQRESGSLDSGSVVTSTIHEPTLTQTATRVSVGGGAPDFVARMLRETTTRSRTWLPVSSTWRWTQTGTAYDSYGLPTDVTELADLSTANDDTCTHTDYARNTGAYLIDFPSQVVTTDCTPNPGPTNHVAGSQTLYDGTATVGAAPTQGLPTKTLALASFNGTTPVWKQTGRTGYDANGRATSGFDALDRQTTTAYTPATGGPVTQTVSTNPVGWSTTTTVDPGTGKPTSVVDANGKRTDALYDPLGELLKVWLPGRDRNTQTPSLEYAYTLRANGANAVLTKKLGPGGNQIASYQLYDGRMRLRQTQTPTPQANGGRMIADVGYDSRGLKAKDSVFWNGSSAPTDVLAAFADADVANQHRYSYDGLDRQTLDQFWSNAAYRWQSYTRYEGDRTAVIPPAGGTTTQQLFDARGDTTELRQFLVPDLGGAYQYTTYTYDRAKHLTGVHDPAGNAWSTGYDLRGRVTSSSDPDKGASTMTYDDAGQLLTATDARGITLTHTYDTLGRPTALWQGPSGTGTRLADYTYDTLARGHLTSATHYAGGNGYTTAVTGYDTGYRPLGTVVTVPSVEGSLAGTWTTTTAYNVDGSPASVTYPAGGGLAAETVTYTYDTNGFALTSAGQDTYVSGTAYYPWGDVNRRTLGTGTKRVQVTTTIDEATRRLTTNQTQTENQTTPGTWVEQLTENYGYDPAGNVLGINETQAGATVSNQCFTYDPFRQLTEAWTTTASACQAGPAQSVVGGPDPYWTSYRYDSVSLRTSVVTHAPGGDTTRTYAYPAAGQPRPHTLSSVTASGGGTDTFAYDAAGNTTSRTLAGQPGQPLTWDPEGHLASIGTTNYVYDATGNRLLGKDSSATTLYLGQTELRAASGTVTATRFYGNGAVRTSTGGLAWQVGDHHGTAQLTITATALSVTRRKFDPFGNPRGTQSTWPTTRGYVNGTTDPTGLTHLGAREYDPSIGRFISVDPVFDRSDPQSWQGYAYADNSPVTSSDPTGRYTSPLICPDGDCRHSDAAPASSPAPSCAQAPSCYGPPPARHRPRCNDEDCAVSPRTPLPTPLTPPPAKKTTVICAGKGHTCEGGGPLVGTSGTTSLPGGVVLSSVSIGGHTRYILSVPGADPYVLPEGHDPFEIANVVSYYFTHGAKSDKWLPTEHWVAGACDEYLKCGIDYSEKLTHDYIAWLGGWEAVDAATGMINHIGGMWPKPYTAGRMPEVPESEYPLQEIGKFIGERLDEMSKAEAADLCDVALTCIES